MLCPFSFTPKPLCFGIKSSNERKEKRVSHSSHPLYNKSKNMYKAGSPKRPSTSKPRGNSHEKKTFPNIQAPSNDSTWNLNKKIYDKPGDQDDVGNDYLDLQSIYKEDKNYILLCFRCSGIFDESNYRVYRALILTYLLNKGYYTAEFAEDKSSRELVPLYASDFLTSGARKGSFFAYRIRNFPKFFDEDLIEYVKTELRKGKNILMEHSVYLSEYGKKERVIGIKPVSVR